ncbi:hypothetical protein [Tenacibaculum sp. SDUM215027]|uniref:hypothetical protein n=1 Tax=Tenacibaculum sp. SDUM215027 TaxID=3422596 RepID=UPI003D3240FF
MKSLISGHIHLNNINLAEIKLQILTEMVIHEQLDVAYKALRKITFSFVTSGRDYDTNQNFTKKELKGIFLSKESTSLIKKFFTTNFINKTLSIAKECGEVQKNEILTFLKVLKTTRTAELQK